jgi:hypothetical protein
MAEGINANIMSTLMEINILHSKRSSCTDHLQYHLGTDLETNADADAPLGFEEFSSIRGHHTGMTPH